MKYDYDAIIVGGGPAGSTAALYAQRAGLNVLLLDKKYFPRDKICGDAISGKSIDYLRELELLDELEKSPNAIIHNFVFSSPNHRSIKVNFSNGHSAKEELYGFVCRRTIFDNILFQEAKRKLDVREGYFVRDVLTEGGRVYGVKCDTDNGESTKFTGKIIVGADGYSSIVARKMNLYDRDPRHWLVATRAYYKGVTDLNDSIEIHYVEDTLPGYFWIFPADDGLANVGLGMIYKSLKKKGIRIRNAHIAATESPFFKKRFANAEMIGDIQGWNLPAGSKRRKIHGDGFILLGDAAGLIDPFSGEGIGNAMCSGNIAAQVIAEACKREDYGARSLSDYPKRLWKTIGPELKMYTRLQRAALFRPLINLVVGRAADNREVLRWIEDMIKGTVSKSELLSPLTYLKLLFK
jgi:geranylgeranyl reductase family protein